MEGLYERGMRSHKFCGFLHKLTTCCTLFCHTLVEYHSDNAGVTANFWPWRLKIQLRGIRLLIEEMPICLELHQRHFTTKAPVGCCLLVGSQPAVPIDGLA